MGKLEFWPDEWVPSFKYKCCPSWAKSWFVAPSIPKRARVILFHDLPNPPEAIIGRSGKWFRHIQPPPSFSIKQEYFLFPPGAPQARQSLVLSLPRFPGPVFQKWRSKRDKTLSIHNFPPLEAKYKKV